MFALAFSLAFLNRHRCLLSDGPVFLEQTAIPNAGFANVCRASVYKYSKSTGNNDTACSKWPRRNTPLAACNLTQREWKGKRPKRSRARCVTNSTIYVRNGKRAEEVRRRLRMPVDVIHRQTGCAKINWEGLILSSASRQRLSSSSTNGTAKILRNDVGTNLACLVRLCIEIIAKLYRCRRKKILASRANIFLFPLNWNIEES